MTSATVAVQTVGGSADTAAAAAAADAIRRKHDEISAKLAREAEELRNDKTDRAALADLFTELALRLNNQFHLPGE